MEDLFQEWSTSLYVSYLIKHPITNNGFESSNHDLKGACTKNPNKSEC